jgi:hypothetical protein
MGNCSSTSNCNPCGPDFNAINQLATKAGAYARQANTYATNAENSWLEFNALYLGAFAVAPTVDNEGDPLQVGALYYNTASNELFAWNGTVWVVVAFNASTNFISNNSTEQRNLIERFSDVVNVKDYGATGDGITNDEPAFSAAIAAAVGSDTIDNSFNIQFPLCVRIFVPAGNYLLNNIVNNHGKDVTYILDHGASFSPTAPLPYTGTSRLNGRVVREGLHFSAYHFGIKDKAGTLSIRGNPIESYDEGAFINGFANPFQLAEVSDRDSCTLYVDNRNQAPSFTVANANYTATTITPSIALTQDQIKLLRVGMVIDTRHAIKYSGFITSWANDGTSVTVSGWFQTGNTAPGQVPANGPGALFNNFTKVFSQNNIVWMDRGVDKATRGAGFEMGLWNQRSSPGSIDPSGATNTDYLWGFDASAAGKYPSTVGFLTRGQFGQSFHSLPQAMPKTLGQAYSRTAGVVTVTSADHGLATNDILIISSATDIGLNGYATITVTGLSTFTFNTTSVGAAIGTLTWECGDYSKIGFLYGGDGVGLKYENITNNEGVALEVINAGNPINPVAKIYGTGLIESKTGIALQTAAANDAIFFAEQIGTANAIYRTGVPLRAWNVVGWTTGEFGIYDQTGAVERLNFESGANINATANFKPSVDDTYTCGANGARWSAIWATNGTIQTSDEREKKDITDSELGLNFINNLRPVSYKWKVGGKSFVRQVFRNKDGEEVDPSSEGAIPAEIITVDHPGNRVHFGLLAQEVKAALPEGVDFGGWVLTDKDNQDSQQALRYDQFIAPLIKAVQELSQENKDLKTRIESLELNQKEYSTPLDENGIEINQ